MIWLTALIFCYTCNLFNSRDRESLINLELKKESKNFEIDGDTFTVVVREEYRIGLYCRCSEQTSCGKLVSFIWLYVNVSVFICRLPKWMFSQLILDIEHCTSIYTYLFQQ